MSEYFNIILIHNIFKFSNEIMLIVLLKNHSQRLLMML